MFKKVMTGLPAGQLAKLLCTPGEPVNAQRHKGFLLAGRQADFADVPGFVDDCFERSAGETRGGEFEFVIAAVGLQTIEFEITEIVGLLLGHGLAVAPQGDRGAG